MEIRKKDYLVESIAESIDGIKIQFFDYLIFQHEVLLNVFSELNDTNHNIELVKIVTEYSKIKVDGGYQYTLHGNGRLKEEKSITYSAENYSPPLDKGWLVSELYFDYKIYNQKFTIYFYGKNMVIKPAIPKNDLNNILTKIKQSIYNIKEITLITAKEFLDSAISDYISGRYRSSSHNIYYSLFNIIKSTQSNYDIININLRHGYLKTVLKKLFTQIQNEQHPIFKSFKEAVLFKVLPFDSYIETIDDAYELRQKADYKINFFAGVFSQNLYNVITNVDQLYQIINYLNEPFIFQQGNELILHTPFFEFLSKCPVEKLTIDDKFLAFSGFIISPKYNTAIIIKELLKKETILYTPSHFLDSDNTLYGKISKQDDGYLVSISYRPEKDYIELSLENAVMWSNLSKPVKIRRLSEQNEDDYLHFIFFNIPFTLELFSDGRIYLLSEIKYFNSLENWEYLKNFIKLLFSVIGDIFAPQYRVVLNYFPFEFDVYE